MLSRKSRSAAIATVVLLTFALFLSAASGSVTTSAASTSLSSFVSKGVEGLRMLSFVFSLATEPASQPQPSLTEDDILQCSGEPTRTTKPVSQT